MGFICAFLAEQIRDSLNFPRAEGLGDRRFWPPGVSPEAIACRSEGRRAPRKDWRTQKSC